MASQRNDSPIDMRDETDMIGTMDFPVEEYLNEGPQNLANLSFPEAVATLSLDRKGSLIDSVQKCVNVREVSFEVSVSALPDWFKAFKKLRVLTIDSSALKTLPAWLGELKDLRRICISNMSLSAVPEFVWKLPRLEELWLFDTGLTHLKGIERAPSLRHLVVNDDELVGALSDIAARLKNGKNVKSVAVEQDSFGSPGIRIMRKLEVSMPASLAKRAALVPTLPEGFDCRGIDLRGATFEDEDLNVDLSNARLEGATFRRCRIFSKFIGARAEGATFEQCSFDGADLQKLKGRGLVIRGCHLAADFGGADLTDAQFVDLAPDSFLRFSKATLRGARVDAVFTTASNGTYADFSKADLRGAQIRCSLTKDAAARVAKSKMRLVWKKAKTKGAKTDAKTSLTYVALAQPSVEAATGSIATSVGTLSAVNGACWCVVGDAVVMRAWGGSILDKDYNELPNTDFGRAMEGSDATLKVGSGKAQVVTVGDCGWTDVWKDGESYCLLDANEGKDLKRNSAQGRAVFGAAVAQLKAKHSNKVGAFEVTSGCMTLLVPYLANPFSMAHIESAVRSGKTKQSADKDGILVPVPNGTYTVTEETLAGGGLDSGEPVFYTRVRIDPAKAKATNEKTKSAAKAAKPTKAKAKKGAASTATPGRPKRFELSEGASNKFWAIAHKGSSLHVHYGRIGTEGQSLVKNFPTEAAAAKEQDRLIAEKVRKGYAPCK